ncbi:MAG: WG repeat-containing protein [Bacteroidota bacterium]
MIHLQKTLILLSFFGSTLFLNAQQNQVSPTEKWDMYTEIAFSYPNQGKWVERIRQSENGYSKETEFINNVLKRIKSDNYLIRVRKKDKFGWTNVLGELIIPIEYDYGVFGPMYNGLICVKKKEKWGCIDFKNKVVIPFKYEKMSPFRKGFSEVTLNGKMGYINNAGVEVIKAIYDKVEPFSKGVAIVMKDNKYGFIDTTGTTIGTNSYDAAYDFDENKFGYVKIGTKYGVVDSKGVLLFSDEYDEAPKALNNELFKVRKNYIYGLVDRTGKFVIPYKYNSISDLFNNPSNDKESADILIASAPLYGFIKTDGTVLSEFIFTKADHVFHGEAQVEIHADGVTKKGAYVLKTKNFKVDTTVEDVVVETTSSYNSSANKGNSNAGTDKKTIKNTSKNQLYVKAGSSTSRLNGGSSSSFPCKDAIYYMNDDGKGNHTVKGSLISGEKEDCGKTINAVGGN